MNIRKSNHVYNDFSNTVVFFNALYSDSIGFAFRRHKGKHVYLYMYRLYTHLHSYVHHIFLQCLVLQCHIHRVYSVLVHIL